MAVTATTHSRTAYSTTGTTVVLTKPTSLAAGDILVAFIFTGSGGATISGWNSGPVATGDVSGFGLYLQTFTKVADSADAAASNFTFTTNSDNRRLGYLLRVTGDFSTNNSTDYIVSDNDSDITISGSTFTFPGGITPLAANALLLLAPIGGKTAYNGTNPYSNFAITNNNPSWTTLYNEGMPGGAVDSILTALVHATYSAITTTGNYSVDSTDVGNEVGAVLIAINETTNVTVSPAVIQKTATVQAPTVTGGANVSPTVIQKTASVQAPTITTANSKWTNKAKTDTSPTITNKTKS